MPWTTFRVYKCALCSWISQATGHLCRVDPQLLKRAHKEVTDHFYAEHPEIVGPLGMPWLYHVEMLILSKQDYIARGGTDLMRCPDCHRPLHPYPRRHRAPRYVCTNPRCAVIDVQLRRAHPHAPRDVRYVRRSAV